jgi:hypothetical protein
MTPTAVHLPTVAYFFASHMLAVASHVPPAFTQSARFVILLRSGDLPAGGLADGEVLEPLDELPLVPGDFIVSLPDELPEPVVPDGLLGVEGFDGLGLVWAAASAGARATTATRSVSMSLYIGPPPLSKLPIGVLP